MKNICDYTFKALVVILIVGLLLPLPPVSPDYLEFIRAYFLYGVTGLLLLLWAVSMWLDRTFRLRRGPLDLPIFFIFLTTVLATIFSHNHFYSILGVPGRHEATLPTVLSLLALYYAVSTLTTPKWTAIYLKIAGLAILLSCSVFAVTAFSPLLKKYVTPSPPIFATAPSLAAAWNVATAVIGDQPLLGSGPTTFAEDYLSRRPLWTNDQPDWSARYTFSANFWLQILTENGLLGFLAWLLLAGTGAYLVAKKQTTAVTSVLGESRAPRVVKVGIGLMGLLSLISPLNLTLLVFMWLLLAFLAAGQSDLPVGEGGLPAGRQVPRAAGATATILIVTTLLITLLGTLGYKAVAAEYYYQQSLNDILNNGGRRAYRLQQQAVSQNPYVDYYHRAYAQTNLALAAALSQETDPSDSDQAAVKTLLDQAVREVKIITEELSPENSENWQTRAAIYGGLGQAATDNQTQVLQAYLTSVALDPLNPQLRLLLGQLYVTSQDYQNAAGALLTTVRLKDDWAPGHYQLAQIYKSLKMYPAALAEMKIVPRLVTTKEDLKKATDEIAALTQLIKQASPSAKN